MAKEDKKAEKKIAELEQQISALEQELEKAKNEKQDIYEQLQRVSADYINYQKRTARQTAESVAYEKKSILRSLLPSIDNFEHALAHAGTVEGEQALDNIVKGIELVFAHMLDALKAHGVERIDALGQPFSPDLHEAMMQRTDPDKEDGVVLEVYQAGYKIGDQVLRPSKVIVNKLHPAAPQQSQQPQQPEDETTDTEPEE